MIFSQADEAVKVEPGQAEDKPQEQSQDKSEDKGDDKDKGDDGKKEYSQPGGDSEAKKDDAPKDETGKEKGDENEKEYGKKKEEQNDDKDSVAVPAPLKQQKSIVDVLLDGPAKEDNDGGDDDADDGDFRPDKDYNSDNDNDNEKEDGKTVDAYVASSDDTDKDTDNDKDKEKAKPSNIETEKERRAKAKESIASASNSTATPVTPDQKGLSPQSSPAPVGSASPSPRSMKDKLAMFEKASTPEAKPVKAPVKRPKAKKNALAEKYGLAGAIPMGGMVPGSKHPKYNKQIPVGSPGARGRAETRPKRSNTIGGEIDQAPKTDQATIQTNKRRRRKRKKINVADDEKKLLETEQTNVQVSPFLIPSASSESNVGNKSSKKKGKSGKNSKSSAKKNTSQNKRDLPDESDNEGLDAEVCGTFFILFQWCNVFDVLCFCFILFQEGEGERQGGGCCIVM